MKTMVCIGDSLTEGADIPVGHTWPALVSNTLNLDVASCGIGGDTTQGMLSRFYPEVIGQKREFVFIMGGTNDLWWGCDVRATLANLFSMVVQARHHGIAPVIGLPLPINVAAAEVGGFSPPLGGYGRFTEKLEALVEALIRHAAESEVAVIDLHRLFLEDNRQIRANLFLPDGLHPNKAGHLIIAREIASILRQELNL